MKAQDYVDIYLPLVKEVKDKTDLKELPYRELKELAFKAFLDFNDEVIEIAKARKAIKDKAIISIIREIAQKWGKFCRIMNQQQEIAIFNEELFLKHWKEKLKF